jgi:ABC-2 type transport system permease protein
MTAFINHFSFEFRTGIRNKSLLLLNYLFPLGFYLMAGALMTGMNPAFRESLIPAMVFFTVLTSALLGLPETIVTAREAGILRSFKIHGIPKGSILLIPALTTILHNAIVAAIITITAPALFQATMPASPLSLVLAFILMTIACTGLGMLIGVVSPNSRATILLGQVIFLPSMLIGGLMFPAHMLPSGLDKLAVLMPSNHAMNVVNGWQSGGIVTLNPYVSVVILLAGGVLAFALAVYLFNWDNSNRSRKARPILALLALLPYGIGVLLSLL